MALVAELRLDGSAIDLLLRDLDVLVG